MTVLSVARRLALLAVISIPSLSASAPATVAADGAAVPVMVDARVVGDNSRSRFVADLSGDIDLNVFTLADPYRIVIDLPEIRFALPKSAGTEGRGLVSAFRYGLISTGKSRIVLDATGPVKVDRSFVIAATGKQPARLVVDVIPTTRAAFLKATAQYRQAQEQAAPSTKGDKAVAVAPAVPGKLTVVVDPGHGGIDLGARSRSGTLEKDVTLAFAKVFGEKLKATGRYNVLFTRTDDSFISLGDRVAFARDHNADLFVSIHANSFRSSVARGATIYTVSDEASDRMAAEMASSENNSDVLAGIDIKGNDSNQVKDILLDLTRRETHNFGVVFARNLVKEMGVDINMFKDPHQTAAFKVLEAPDVPSALVELGFLSNRIDEKHLLSAAWRDKTADAMVRAVGDYFRTRIAEKTTP